MRVDSRGDAVIFTLPPITSTNTSTRKLRGPWAPTTVGLPCVTWRFPYPFSHLSTSRKPLVHACQSHSRRYFQVSKICQKHRESVSETLRRDDTALQVILGDLSGQTRSNGRIEKVLFTPAVIHYSC